MNSLREELERAFAFDDEVQRDFQAWQAKHPQPVIKSQPELKRRDGDFNMQQGRPIQQQPQQQTSAAMDADLQAEWNKWAEAHIARAFDTHDKVLKGAIGYALAHERRAMREHVAQEIEKLRTELEGDSNKVLEWPGRRTDVA